MSSVCQATVKFDIHLSISAKNADVPLIIPIIILNIKIDDCLHLIRTIILGTNFVVHPLKDWPSTPSFWQPCVIF